MREEYELEVLDHYDIEVKGTRKIRGAFFCDTNEGTMLLKETKISGQRAPSLYMALNCLEQRGNVKVDTPVFTREGELLVDSRDGRRYMLKKWYQGRECDIRQEKEVLRAAETLAVLHNELERVTTEELRSAGLFELPVKDRIQNLPALNFPAGKDPVDEIRRHNRELKKVRSFIRSRVTKNEFEYLFLENFEKMYQLAEQILARMESSGCPALYQRELSGRNLAHGEYNYHNLLVAGSDMAVTNFEHMHAGIRVHDLYYFIRKIMEKYTWKQKTGQRILEAYENTRKLGEDEKEYVGLHLAYPEKFWKTASSYYHSNKAWLPQKYVEKLELAVKQTEEKRVFLESIFSIGI